MTTARSVYATRVTHVRRTPWRRAFAHQSSMWVVDVDRMPRGGRIASFFQGEVVARDHLDGRSGSLRDALMRFVQAEGIVLGDVRILLAAQPRAFGFCFNPISVWWCLAASGEVVATIVEVHNTYGDRHAYLLPADDGGRAPIEKAMYVSPFHGVEGTYEVIAPVPGDRLDLRVTLHTPDGARFSASLVGRRIDSPHWWTALASLRDAVRIRAHGITLWARRLPIQPRPPHQQEALK